MLIDWFTVGAQVLNFLVLVWLLKRFLYKPILDAIGAREQRIAAELADADAKRAEAQQERETFQQKNQEFDQQRAARLAKAVDEAKTERQRLLDEARQAADALRAKRQVALRQESEQLNQALMNRTQQEVFAIARKTLTDLAGASLEERLVDVFVKRLESLDGEPLAVLTKTQKTATDPARLRSAFDLSADQRATIQTALNKTFATEIPVRFETSPDLISGIELSTNGQRVAWSIAEYLKSLEQEVGELLKAKDQSDVEPKAAQPAPDAAHP
ncbi:F0F1 ATP synthase subunit delta [Thiorhodovibrio frisius]|uniref:ATP synthase subunit b n=1 Tax=Thiorhodovibrio frisius TaxID=631362 RepID=H8Z6N2_9GAMM|nr:F0F1 ATP synthase subunit delta [Thiorhodovibrio frisius]EIC20748.1 alternate F1F0 ATPase, F0 subunit B [Thiorhodovibrio frisius]WPL21496.1 F-type ATPase subunit b [Thiorhodovibrio frisius]